MYVLGAGRVTVRISESRLKSRFAVRAVGTMAHVYDLAAGKLLRRIPRRELDFNLDPPAFRWRPPR